MALDWNHFTADQWAGMTGDQWSTFVLDQLAAVGYLLDGASVFAPSQKAGMYDPVERSAAFKGGAEKQAIA